MEFYYVVHIISFRVIGKTIIFSNINIIPILDHEKVHIKYYIII